MNTILSKKNSIQSKNIVTDVKIFNSTPSHTYTCLNSRMTVTSAHGIAPNFVFSQTFKRNLGIDAQMMRFAAFIIRHAEWRHGRSRGETKYTTFTVLAVKNHTH